MNDKDFDRIKSVLEGVPASVGELLDEHELFEGDSQAAAAFNLHQEAALVVLTQAGLALTNASDHLFALERALTPPVMTLAPWTIARGVLEASALTLWNLDPELSAAGQVSRSMTLRFDGFLSQRKFARRINLSSVTKGGSDRALKKLEAGINTIMQQADVLKIVPKRDSDGKVIGFGEGKRSKTDMINAVFLHGETSYRILSAVAHGEIWAVQQVGYRIIGGQRKSGLIRIEQSMSPLVARYLIFAPLLWYAAAAERYFDWNGWDVKQLTSRIDATYKDAGVVRQHKTAAVYPKPPRS